MEGEKVGEVILTMKDIDKSFPGVHALKKVSLEVRRGEVHALMGENGAGGHYSSCFRLWGRRWNSWATGGFVDLLQ